MLKYTNIVANGPKTGPQPDLIISGVPFSWNKEERPALRRDEVKQAPPRKSKERRALAAAPVHTLETEPSSEAGQSSLEKLKENRLRCLETADLLQQMADFDFKDALHQAADKIQNCSLAGAFRSVAPGVANKIGQALCRCRLCPNCQRVLAARRRSSFMEWLDMNSRPLAGFKFYHMVLTVRHSDALRAGLYTGELLEAFAALRGSGKTCNRARREWWDKRVSGGIFSVELKPSKRGNSPHIHLHITLFCAPGCIPIYRKDRNSEFVKQASRIWRELTNDKKGKAVFLDTVYYLDEAGERQNYKQGEPVELLYKAVAECMKYTLKSDEADLSKYAPAFLRELLTTPNRYFGRFGVLSTKTVSPYIFCELDRLNTNFKDLEQVAEKEKKSLYNPKTQTFVSKEDTRIALSFFRNTIIKYSAVADSTRADPNKRGDEPFYSFRDSRRVAYLQPDAESAALRYLARTIRGKYEPDNDLALSGEGGALPQA